MTKYVGGYNTGPTAIYKLLFIQVLTSENQERKSNTNNVYVRGMRPPHDYPARPILIARPNVHVFMFIQDFISNWISLVARTDPSFVLTVAST